MGNESECSSILRGEFPLVASGKHCVSLVCDSLTLDDCCLDSSSPVRNLDVLFDRNLSFDSHVSSICKTAFFPLKNISKLRPRNCALNVKCRNVNSSLLLD